MDNNQYFFPIVGHNNKMLTNEEEKWLINAYKDKEEVYEKISLMSIWINREGKITYEYTVNGRYKETTKENVSLDLMKSFRKLIGEKIYR